MAHEHNKSGFFIDPPTISACRTARFLCGRFRKRKGRNICPGKSFLIVSALLAGYRRRATIQRRSNIREPAAVSPAKPCSAASSPSSIVRCMASKAMAAPAPTATCRRTSSSCRRRAPKPGSSCCRSAADGIPGPTIRCSGRSTPTISGSMASKARDFRNLRENGLVRVRFTLPANIRLIDPATNLPSAETTVDIWRMVPTVNDVKLTGPDGLNPWPRGPNRHRRISARRTLRGPAGTGARCAAQIMRRSRRRRRSACLTTSPRFSARCSRIIACVRSAMRFAPGRSPLPDPDPPLSGLEQAGKAVFARSCAQCHGGPGQSTTQAPVVALPRHLHAMPAPRGHR